ncbi:MAG: ABC transporter substrate-binding protein [Acidobacteria bacterium]|nr:ABC transporter substrate-binding protein [Acidobacteriota bacterium]
MRGARGWVLGAGCLCVALAVTLGAQARPTRIVSLIPAVTEMLFAMGAGDQVVGVSAFDTFPEEVATRTRVGGLFDPNVEAILALRSDLVVVYGSQDELIGRLSGVHIPLFSYRRAGLPDITETIRALGVRTGHAIEAETLASRIEQELDEIRQSVHGRPRPRTLIVFGREEGTMRGLYVSGGVGFLHDMLEVAGGVNVMADVPREGLQLSLELLLVRAPEVVIELRLSEPWSAARQARETAAWSRVSIPASRAGRIRFLSDAAMTVPGPRVGAAVRKLADALHGAAQ